MKKRILQNNQGMSELVAFAITSMIVVILLVALWQSALLFTSVVKINNVAELVAKKIQLSGMVDTDTQNLLNKALEDTRITDYTAVVTITSADGTTSTTITATTITSKKIQLNDTYTVQLQGHTKYFGVNKSVHGNAVGISEVYFK